MMGRIYGVGNPTRIVRMSIDISNTSGSVVYCLLHISVGRGNMYMVIRFVAGAAVPLYRTTATSASVFFTTDFV